MTEKNDDLILNQDAVVHKHFDRLIQLLRLEQDEDRERYGGEEGEDKENARARAGRGLMYLALLEEHYMPTGQRLLTFGFDDNRPLPLYILKVGDVVSLSARGIARSERPMGTVYERAKNKVTVAFQRHLPGWTGRETRFHLFLAENMTTFQRMFAAVEETKFAAHNRLAHLRDVSLGIKKPLLGDPISAEKTHFFNPRLNAEQKKAVCLALQALDTVLILGPPGTGKSSVLVEIIRQAYERRQSILVTAPSNAACDHLLSCLIACGLPVTRLGHPARMVPELRQHTLNYKLNDHAYAKMIDDNERRLEQLARIRERRQERRTMDWDEKQDMRDEVRQLKDEIRNLKDKIFNDVWSSSDIVIATHTASGDSLLKARHFDWVLMDEASQALEPGAWISAARGEKIILAGDFHQLSPTVQSMKAEKRGLGVTLFERLYKTVPEQVKINLRVQYRMHENIAGFSSARFYQGQLTAHESNQKHVLAGWNNIAKNSETESPLAFLDTAGLGYEEQEDPDSGSRFNPEEAKLVIRELQALLAAGVPAADIGVISPYSAQVKCLRGLISEEAVEVDSVDAFQGREKEVILVSLTRSNTEAQIGFLQDTRRMNVAMTRAKRKLVVIGDSATISQHEFYQAFLDYIDTHSAYRSGWENV